MKPSTDSFMNPCGFCTKLPGYDSRYENSNLQNDLDHRKGRATTLHCGHAYCVICIGKHIEKSSSCPTCKDALTPEDRDRISHLYYNTKGVVTKIGDFAAKVVQLAILVVFLFTAVLTAILLLGSYFMAKGVRKLTECFPLIYLVTAPVGLILRISTLFFFTAFIGEIFFFTGCLGLMGGNKAPLLKWQIPDIYSHVEAFMK